MTKPTIQWYWKISHRSLYTKLNALGGMVGHSTKIKPSFAWQGKLSLLVGDPEPWSPEVFEVRVTKAIYRGVRWDGMPVYGKHRISVRCPKCHAWIPFGRLHQHVDSLRCQTTATIANSLPPIPSLQSAMP